MEHIREKFCCLHSTQTTRNKRKYRFRTQAAMITVASLVALNHGMSISHAAVLVPHIQAENGTIQMDEEDASWIASLYNFASPLGALTGGILSEFFGRRRTLVMALVSMTVGWMIIFLSQSIGVIMAGRCLEGASKTMAVTAATVLMDEITYPTCRGFAFFQYGTTRSLGIFAMMGLATLMDWRPLSLLAAGLSAVTCVSVFLIPESSTWLVRKGHLLRAENALHRIWGPSRLEQATETFEDLKKRFGTQEESSRSPCRITSVCKKLLNPDFLKPFLIMHLLNVFIQLFCGHNLVINYSVDMVSHMTEHYDPYFVSTIVSLVRVFVMFTAGVTINIFGRRGYMMISGIGSAVFAIALGVVMYPGLSTTASAKTRETLSIFLLGAYVASYNAGYQTIPALMIGETQPAAVRGFLCGYIYTMNDFTTGGVVKMYPWLFDTLGLHGMFLWFGISCAVCAVISFLFLPETNGKTLEEIEDYFKQKNIMWITRNKSPIKESVDMLEMQKLCEENSSTPVNRS